MRIAPYLLVIVLVGLGGLEPPTSPLSGVRSSHLSYRPNVLTDNAKSGSDLIANAGRGQCGDWLKKAITSHELRLQPF